MKNKDYIITIQNVETEQYFFTTNHCQEHGLGSNWVPCTYGPLPGYVTPRKELPSGIINNKEDYKLVFGQRYFINGPAEEIPNPQPEFQG